MIDKNSKIYIAGHNGMVGSACWRKLKSEGFTNLIGRSSSELDLKDQKKVEEFLYEEKPDLIIDAAAKVGGILANNNFPYEFLIENMQIQNNLISIAHKLDVKNFIFLGSSCIYPKNSIQPIKEEYLLTDKLESTNQWYAIAKISGVKLIEALRIQYNRNYISLMPTNLYGPNDNYDLISSHVLPAMLRKFHEAKNNSSNRVELWGTGNPMREFLHVDDLANAVYFSMTNPLKESLYNVGTGTDISIKELSEIIKDIIGYNGKILWDSTKPDGTMRKLLDTSKLDTLGWKSEISLKKGIKETYEWYLKSL